MSNCGIKPLGMHTYQSSTAELPVKAWQMTMTLSLVSFNFPHVLYATGTSLRITPDSKVKDGTQNISCSIRDAYGLVMTEVLKDKMRMN